MKKQIIKNQQPAGVLELRYGQDRKKSTPIAIETPLKSRRDNTPVSQNLPIIEVETKTLDQILPSFQSKKEIKKGTDKNSIRAEQQALWDAGAFKGIKNKYGKELSYKEAVDGLEGKLTRQARDNYQSTSRDWIPVGRDKETLREEQEALWNAGAFKGLKNKFGREVSYKEAVDGIEGSMTRQARENYRETVDTKLPTDPMGYIPVRERRKIEENAKARKEGIAKQRELAPRREFTANLNKSDKVVPIEIMDPLDAYAATANKINIKNPYEIVNSITMSDLYPYDYNPEISMDDNNVKFYKEFVDLDLNTKEGLKRAQQILSQEKQENGKPIFSNFSLDRSPQTLQRRFRERYDLMQLNSGNKQKYESFTPYQGEDGNTYYKFSDDKINQKYLSRALASKRKYGLNNGVVSPSKEFDYDGEKKTFNYIPIDRTNATFNQYTISGDDDTTIAYDLWDIAPTQWIPGNKSSAPKIRIAAEDKDIIVGDPETFVVPNSNYSGSSVTYDSNIVPKKDGYPSPASWKYFKENIKHLF